MDRGSIIIAGVGGESGTTNMFGVIATESV